MKGIHLGESPISEAVIAGACQTCQVGSSVVTQGQWGCEAPWQKNRTHQSTRMLVYSNNIINGSMANSPLLAFSCTTHLSLTTAVASQIVQNLAIRLIGVLHPLHYCLRQGQNNLATSSESRSTVPNGQKVLALLARPLLPVPAGVHQQLKTATQQARKHSQMQMFPVDICIALSGSSSSGATCYIHLPTCQSLCISRFLNYIFSRECQGKSIFTLRNM